MLCVISRVNWGSVPLVDRAITVYLRVNSHYCVDYIMRVFIFSIVLTVHTR